MNQEKDKTFSDFVKNSSTDRVVIDPKAILEGRSKFKELTDDERYAIMLDRLKEVNPRLYQKIMGMD